MNGNININENVDTTNSIYLMERNFKSFEIVQDCSNEIFQVFHLDLLFIDAFCRRKVTFFIPNPIICVIGLYWGRSHLIYEYMIELQNILQSISDEGKINDRMLQKIFSKPLSIMSLQQVIKTSEQQQIRQIAVVYLREQIEEYYSRIPMDYKFALKRFLIARLRNIETIHSERNAIGAAIVSVAKRSFSFIQNNGWNELLVCLDKICVIKQPIEICEIGYLLWRNLVSFCGIAMKQHFDRILKFLKPGLTHKISIKIRIECVKAIGIMIEFLENENEIKQFEQYIPLMMNVIDECLQKKDNKNIISGMKVFNNLIEAKV
eukprot:41020_1